MGAFLGISLWVALATVVPGLVTVAVVAGAVIVVDPDLVARIVETPAARSDWLAAGAAITLMVLTQALGILLETLLVERRWLGPEDMPLAIPEGIDVHGETRVTIRPYFEYDGIYLLLAEIGENEDSQGHLKRALAQFFLTNNTLVSFAAGALAAIVVALGYGGPEAVGRAAFYAGLMGACLVLSYRVAIIRFGVMARSLWATRRRRMRRGATADAVDEPAASG